MAFKSEAQRERALKQVATGEITLDQFVKWDAGTPTKLPSRMTPIKGQKIKEVKIIKAKK